MTEPTLIYGKSNEYAAIPWAIRLADGAILLAFRIARKHGIDPSGYVVATRSEDGGETWGEPVVASDHYLVDDREPAMAQDAAGTVWMSVMGQRHRPGPYTCYVVRSRDGGMTWDAPIEFESGREGFLLRHPFLTREGLAWAASLGKQYAPEDMPEAREESLAHGNYRAIVRLTETPEGWDREIESSPGWGVCDEWMAAERRDGLLCGLFRDGDYWISLEHIRGGILGERPKEALWHGGSCSRPFVLKLSDGRWAAAVDQRTLGEIRIWFSENEGETWAGEATVVQKGEWTREEDYGYPTLVEAGGGLLVFFYGYVPWNDKDRGIYMATLALEGGMTNGHGAAGD